MLYNFAAVEDTEVGQLGSYCGDVCCGNEISFIFGGEVGIDEIADFSREHEESHDGKD